MHQPSSSQEKPHKGLPSQNPSQITPLLDPTSLTIRQGSVDNELLEEVANLRKLNTFSSIVKYMGEGADVVLRNKSIEDLVVEHCSDAGFIAKQTKVLQYQNGKVEYSFAIYKWCPFLFLSTRHESSQEQLVSMIPESLSSHGALDLEKLIQRLLNGWLYPLIETTAARNKEWSSDDLEAYFVIEERLKIVFEPVDRLSFERATTLAKMVLFLGGSMRDYIYAALALFKLRRYKMNSHTLETLMQKAGRERKTTSLSNQ